MVAFPLKLTLVMKRALLLMAILGSSLACQVNHKNNTDMKKIEAAVTAASTEFMKINGVQGVGQGKNKKDEDCIVVFTSADSASLAKRIPDAYQGFGVVVQNIGEVEAQ